MSTNSSKTNSKIIVLAGPTGSGKTKLALKIARKYDSVIINADSQQVYQGLPILTAQPNEEEKSRFPHYLYGYVPVGEEYSVNRWLRDVVAIIDNVIGQGATPILVGGTGLYIKCLMHGLAAIPEIASEIRDKARELLVQVGNQAFYAMLNSRDPIMGQRLNPEDSQRILRAWEVMEQTNMSLARWQEMEHKKFYPIERFKGYFLNPSREVIYENINKRFIDMIGQGAIGEVKWLVEQNPPVTSSVWKSHGVPEISAYLRGEMTLESAIEKARQNTRNYAKRQITWFRHQMKEFEEINSASSVSEI